MKRINLLIIALSGFIIISCGGKEAEDNASVEPNDTIAEANSVSLGTEFKMTIDPEGDVDWYEVEAPQQGYLKARTKNVPDELKLRARFATYDEWGDEKENFLTDRSAMPVIVPVYEKGKYYLKVTDYTEGYSEKDFYIKIGFTEEFDTFEPNNEPSSAAKVKLGEEQQSAIFPTGDKDWFSVEVEKQGYLNIGAKNVSDDIDLAAKVATYDEYSSDKINTVKSTTSVPFSVVITEPGEYHIKFKDSYDNDQADDLFAWRVAFLPEMDDYEPNDSVSEAAEIEPGASAEIAIFPEGDSDFFKVSPKEKGTLTVKARAPDDIDLIARMLKVDPEDSGETVTLEDWTNLPLRFDIDDPEQDYFMQFKDRYDNDASRDTFTVSVSFSKLTGDE